MKHIQYYNIADGAFPLFETFDPSKVQTLSEKIEWQTASSPFHTDLPIICVPTWQWTFDSLLQVEQFIRDKTNRDGHYVVSHRSGNETAIYALYQNELSTYFSTFGLAYSPESFVKNTLRHWTTLKESSALPRWLQGLNSSEYIVSQ
jgi:hypothetical protein